MRETDEARAATATSIGQALAEIYAGIAERSMRDLPVYNPALGVEAVGFRAEAERVVGIVVTPWFMNLVVVAAPGGPDLPARPVGSAIEHRFPGGDFGFTVGALDGFGRLDSASLFSPMFEFDDPAVVRAVAEAALAEILTAPTPAVETETTAATSAEAAGPAADPAIDRRALLFGRRGGAR